MRTLSACLRGTVATALLLANILVWMLPVYALILVKLCTAGTARSRVSQWIANCAQQWGAICVWIWKRVSGVHWVVQGVERLNRDGQYLVIANHQSYNDIPSLMCAFDRRAPFFRFFLKQELIWIPVLGPVWWALDYPFMKRHSAAQIARRPELRGSDLETTRRACARYRHQPVTLLNFVEGTRLNPAKKKKQASPFRHLLRPRVGALALTLDGLGPQLHSVLDVTIAYPDGGPGGLWDLNTGRVGRIIVDAREVEVPEHLLAGDYANDPAFRRGFKTWLESLWQEKDQRIHRLVAQAESA